MQEKAQNTSRIEKTLKNMQRRTSDSIKLVNSIFEIYFSHHR